MTVRYPTNARNTFSRLSEDVSEWQHGNLCGHFFSRHHSPLLEHLLKYPDAPFSDADACILKADRKTALALTSFDGKQFVVKRYNVAHIFHRIRLAFQSSRAKKKLRFCKTARRNRRSLPQTGGLGSGACSWPAGAIMVYL